jgi:hypothetical protein
MPDIAEASLLETTLQVDPHTQPLKPILFPKLQIHFTEFPNLLYSNWPCVLNTRNLLRIFSTIKLENFKSFPSIFTDCRRRTRHLKTRDVFPAPLPSLWINQFQGNFNFLFPTDSFTSRPKVTRANRSRHEESEPLARNRSPPNRCRCLNKPLKRKENSSQDLRQCLEVHFCYQFRSTGSKDGLRHPKTHPSSRRRKNRHLSKNAFPPKYSLSKPKMLRFG